MTRVTTPTTKELDETLPAELQELAGYGGPLDVAKAQANTSMTENPTMTTQPKILTESEVLALATQAVASIQSQKDQQSALASQIGKFVTDANESAKALVSASAKIGELEKQLETEKAEAKKSKDDAEDSKKKVAEKSKEADESDNKFKKAKASLDEATKKLADITAEKVVATRTEALDKAGLKTDKRIAKATARKDDGSFEMTDEVFTGYVAELTEVATAAKASVTTTANGTPAPATDKAAKDAEAAKAAANATPGEPNLDQAAVIAQAQASLLNGMGSALAASDAVNKWSDIFKI